MFQTLLSANVRSMLLFAPWASVAAIGLSERRQGERAFPRKTPRTAVSAAVTADFICAFCRRLIRLLIVVGFVEKPVAFSGERLTT